MKELTRGERFKDARTVHNQHGSQTMSTVQKATGVSASLIADLENDEKERKVNYIDVAALAKHYGVTTDWLCGVSQDHHPKPCASSELGLSENSIYFLKSLNDVRSAFDAMLFEAVPSESSGQAWNDAIAKIKCLSGLQGYDLRHYANLCAYYGLDLANILLSAVENNYSVISDFYSLREADPREWVDANERITISYYDFVRFKAGEIAKAIEYQIIDEFDKRELVMLDSGGFALVGNDE